MLMRDSDFRGCGRYEAGAEAGMLSNGREATPDHRQAKKLYLEATSVYPAGGLAAPQQPVACLCVPPDARVHVLSPWTRTKGAAAVSSTWWLECSRTAAIVCRIAMLGSS